MYGLIITELVNYNSILSVGLYGDTKKPNVEYSIFSINFGHTATVFLTLKPNRFMLVPRCTTDNSSVKIYK